MINSPEPISKKDLSISMANANLWNKFFGLPLAGLLMFIYLWRWGVDLNVSAERSADFLYFILNIVAILIFGSILHEPVHGFSWAYFAHKPFRVTAQGSRKLFTLSPSLSISSSCRSWR